MVLIWDIKHEPLFKLNYHNALVMSQTGIMSQWDKWCNASVYVSVIQRLMVCTSSVPFNLPVYSLSACHQHALTRAALTRVYESPCNVLLCLCENACKRSLAICCTSRTLCPVSRLLSAPIQPSFAEQDTWLIWSKKKEKEMGL